MRYAIYFAASAEDRLMQLGNAWLGRDPFAARDLPQPALDGLDAERFHALTGNPRRYGFHGTLKAPFHLHHDKTEAGLVAASKEFASLVAPFEIQGLAVNRLGKFLALTPDQHEPELSAFAATCVRHFETFRAPLSETDLLRRRQSNLTPRQDAYLVDWGYPYVFDEFRFHMTLSNKLEDDRDAELLAANAKSHFNSVTGCPRTCNSFALYFEPERGAPFEVHSVFELTGDIAPVEAESRSVGVTSKETA
ncbi:DUF1045 domain-containing protein [Roseibium sp. SCPC15]|uniref:DUF1045 domain-containing protein n=1 Tax=Roseibium sp. SCP15 TaxID=3141376 RepID=UPI0033362B9D